MVAIEKQEGQPIEDLALAEETDANREELKNMDMYEEETRDRNGTEQRVYTEPNKEAMLESQVLSEEDVPEEISEEDMESTAEIREDVGERLTTIELDEEDE